MQISRCDKMLKNGRDIKVRFILVTGLLSSIASFHLYFNLLWNFKEIYPPYFNKTGWKTCCKVLNNGGEKMVQKEGLSLAMDIIQESFREEKLQNIHEKRMFIETGNNWNKDKKWDERRERKNEITRPCTSFCRGGIRSKLKRKKLMIKQTKRNATKQMLCIWSIILFYASFLTYI